MAISYGSFQNLCIFIHQFCGNRGKSTLSRLIFLPEMSVFFSGLAGGFLAELLFLCIASLSRTGGLKVELSESFGVEELLGSFAHQKSSSIPSTTPVLSALLFGGSLRNLWMYLLESQESYLIHKTELCLYKGIVWFSLAKALIYLSKIHE